MLNAFRAGGSKTKKGSGKSKDKIRERAKLNSIELGYNVKHPPGLRALRVPFQGFAERHGPLDLVLAAVKKTGDYSVFDSALIASLFEFKWQHLALGPFIFDLLKQLAYVAIVINWSQVGAEIFEDEAGRGSEELGFGEIFGGPNGWVVFCWCFTTVQIMDHSYSLVQQARQQGVLTLLDIWSMLELFHIVAQSIVNLLFILRFHVPAAIQDELEDYDALLNGTALADCWATRSAARGGIHGLETVTCNRTGYHPGAYVILQACVVLTTTTRLLYFFRGSLVLGTLVASFVTIVRDSLPLLLLVAVFLLSFSFSITVLLQAEIRSDVGSPWHSWVQSFFVTTNMGLYTLTDAEALSFQRHEFVLVIYQIFMLIVQIVLLNLLIAIMAESNQKTRAVAKLVGRFQRAQLGFVYEQRLQRRLSIWQRLVRWLRPTLRNDPWPRWIHVLQPLSECNEARAAGKAAGPRPEQASPAGGEELSEATHRLLEQLSETTTYLSEKVSRLEESLQRASV